MSEPSIVGLNLSKAELIDLADRMRAKAQAEHHETRYWRNRATIAESRLAIFTADKETHV